MAHVLVPAEDSFVRFAVGASTTGPFAFTFTVFEKDDLEVRIDGVALLTSDWTVVFDTSAEGGFTGGTITLNSAVDNVTLDVVSIIPAVRGTDFGSGPLSMTSLNTEFDKLTAISRDSQRDIARSIRFDFADSTSDLPLMSANAGKVIAVNSGGTDIEFTTIVATAGLTAGSVIFSGGGAVFSQDNANFFWDDTNNRLGIGTASPLHELDIVGGLRIIHTATSSDEHAQELFINAAGFGDVKAVQVEYTTGAMTLADSVSIFRVGVDESLASGGTIVAYGMALTAPNGVRAIALGTTPGVEVIGQQVGTFGNMDSALVNAVDRLTEFITSDPGGANNVDIFVANSDTVTIGDAARFTNISVVLETVASGAGVKPTFEFSTGVGTWSAFTPSDGTDGFRNSSSIGWALGSIPTWAVGTGSEFLIRITRTQGGLGTVPKEDKIQISAAVEHTWDENANVTPATIRTNEAAGSTMILAAFDVDGAAYTTFGTLTANNIPTFDLSDAVTVGGTNKVSRPVQNLSRDVGDETTDLTTGTAKLTFRMPYAFTLTDIRCSVNTAPTGATIIVDVNEGGATILSTKLTIDATELTSTTAAIPPVISDAALADDAEITIDIDQIGSTIAGKGLKITLIGNRN